MNRIILIGNGFDIAHGKETSYRNFIDDYWKGIMKKIKNTRPKTFETDDLKAIGYTISFSSNESVKSLKDEARELCDKLIVKNNFLNNITDKNYLEKWVDIEDEYYTQLKEIISQEYRDDSEIEKLNSEFERVKKLLEVYLRKVEEEHSSDKVTRIRHQLKKKIYSSFNQRDFLEEIMQDDSNLGLIPKQILFLNFNYTDTHLYYSQNQSNEPINSDLSYINIHGNLHKEDNNPIIFGFGDEIDDDYKKIEKLNNNEYLENIKSIKYLETDNYKELIKFINSDYYQVFIFGHSCGISDRTLLNTLFEHENCVSIKPYYHQKNEKEDNYSDIIRNISRNFNDKVKMRNKVVNKKYCEPLHPF